MERYNLAELLKEAKHSYQVYLQCTGAIETQDAKLALLKWPDIAESAIEYIESNSQDKLEILIKDLESALFYPIKTICQATAERAEQALGKPPKAVIIEAETALLNPDKIVAKRGLLKAIDKMFAALHAVTGEHYPELRPI